MVKRALALAALLVTAAAGVGCEDESVGQAHGFATTAYGVKSCDAPNGQLVVRRELRLFANRSHDVDKTATALQRYYRHFGIDFYRVQPVQVVATQFVEDMDETAGTAALTKQFPGVDFSDDGLKALSTSDPALYARVIKAVLNWEFSGALDFMRQYGGTGQGVTNVVLLDSLFSPGSPEMERDKVLGISLAPILIRELRRSGMDAAGAFGMVDFPADFSPVVFISDTNVKWLEDRAGSVHRDLVLGHEFGHSAGLVHKMDKTNLMNPSTDGTETCTLALTEDQIAVMKEGLGLAPPALGRELVVDAPGAATRGPAVAPAIIAGILRGDIKALRTLLWPLHGDPAQD
jgi:hypothetical protein